MTINILIPIAGNSSFFAEDEYPYPKPLIDVCGKMMIEHVVDNYSMITGEKRFIFVIKSSDCDKYHLDDVLRLVSNHKCKIVKIDNETKGAACSAIMAIKYINNKYPLIIANADQTLDVDMNLILKEVGQYDGGVISFNSAHPRWSYARLNKDNFIVETSEKRPISNHAIAGFYFFSKGSEFVKGAMSMIRKDANIEGLYYVAPVFNEMILKRKKIKTIMIDNDKYHTFYTPNKIKEFERNNLLLS